MQTGSRRMPELDGLRGIAVLLVISLHLHWNYVWIFLAGSEPSPSLRILSLGWSGVDLFFVLSGFLLGGILMDNREAPNLFRVFYTRRTTRILPVYYLVVGTILLAPLPPVVADGGMLRGLTLPSWTYLTFTQNIAMAWYGVLGAGWLVHTWTLAVEEQFYIVLAPLIRWCRPGWLPWLLVGMIASAPLFRYIMVTWVPGGEWAFYHLLPARWDTLLLGALIAWGMRREHIAEWLRRHTRLLYVALAALVSALFTMVAAWQPWPPLPPVEGFSLLASVYAMILLIAVTETRGPITFVLRNRVLGWIGLVSYFVYMTHQLVRGAIFWLVLGRQPYEAPTGFLDLGINMVTLAVTFALAALSWRLMERRMIALGHRARYEQFVGVRPS